MPRRGGTKHVWGIRPAGLPVRRLPPGEGREEGARGEQVGSSLILQLSARARWRPRNSPVPPGGRSKRRDDPWPVGRRQSAVGSQRIASGDFDCRLLSANCLVTAAVSQLGVGSAGGPPSSSRFEAARRVSDRCQRASWSTRNSSPRTPCGRPIKPSEVGNQ